MPTTEEAIQKAVLSLEAGRLAKVVRRAAMVAAVAALSLFYLIHEFRGLSMAQAMDQAQIGREILRGHGFETKFVRPLAIGELQRHGKDVRNAIWADTYNAPIPPLLDAAAIFIPIWNGWEMTRRDFVYSGDRAIALLEVVFFLASVAVLYLVALELFDKRLAFMACGLVLICDMMWEYSLSGLPQMWLLLLLNGTFYLLIRGMKAAYAGQPVLRWLAGAGLGFGLLALSHAITIWLFVPALIFCGLFFRPRLRCALVMLAVFLAVYSPWLLRNAAVCGDPFGVARFSILEGIEHSEAGHMRRDEIDLKNVSIGFLGQKIRTNLIAQGNRLIEYLGWSCVAPLAFLSLLHAFKRPVTAAFRWLVIMMWAGATAGMTAFGMQEYHSLAANQLHLLFVPIFICYGLAYLLVQWERRLELALFIPKWKQHRRTYAWLRGAMVALVFFLSGIPMLSRIVFSGAKWPVQWPPYVPPYIATIRNWIQPGEIIGSDVPWAVAWYADRKSIWLPYNSGDLFQISDYLVLGGPVSALYFTPVSGTENTLGDLTGGEYRHWAAYIVRTVDLAKVPYHWRILLGMPDCVFYADRDRRLDNAGTTDNKGGSKP